MPEEEQNTTGEEAVAAAAKVQWVVYVQDGQNLSPKHLCSFEGVAAFYKYWEAIDLSSLRRESSVLVMKKEHAPQRRTSEGVWAAEFEVASRAPAVFTALVEGFVTGKVLEELESDQCIKGVELARRSSCTQVSIWCGEGGESDTAIASLVQKHLNSETVFFQFHNDSRRTVATPVGGVEGGFETSTVDTRSAPIPSRASPSPMMGGQSPKLPVKRERVSTLPEEAKTKVTDDFLNMGGIDAKTAIAMQGRWAIWYDYSKAGMTESEYANNLRMLSGFKTVTEFHKYWDTIDLQRLKHSANIRIFRAGILPFWTVNRNVNGGQFSIRLQGTEEGKSAAFEHIMEMLVNHEFTDSSKLNGACFGKRGDKQHIKIWSSTTDMAVQAVCDQLQYACEVTGGSYMKITFISFKELHAEKLAQAEARAEDGTAEAGDPFLEDDDTESRAKFTHESPAPRGLAETASKGSLLAGSNRDWIHQAIVMSLVYLLGLLINDVVFDVAPLPISRAYYCALLDSLARFPHILRILAPVAILVASLLYRLLATERSIIEAQLDAASTILMGIGGLAAFYHTTSLSDSMCSVDLTHSNMDAVAEMRAQLIPWHAFMGVTYVLSLGMQFFSWRCANTKTKTD